MGSITECCGEEVDVAAFFEFESLSQIGNGGGKIADGEIRLTDVGKEMLEFLLAEMTPTVCLKNPSGKIGIEGVACEEVALRVKF